MKAVRRPSARNAGAQDASGDVLVFVDADVVPHADAFARIRRAFDDDAAAHRSLRVVRRFAGSARHGVGVPEPPSSPRSPVICRAGDDLLDRARSGAARRVPRGRRLRPRSAVARGRGSRHPSLGSRRSDRARPRRSGHAPEALEPRRDGADRLREARDSVGRPHASAQGHVDRAEPRLAAPSKRRGSVVAAVSVLRRKPRITASAIAALVVLNAPFYRLLAAAPRACSRQRVGVAPPRRPSRHGSTRGAGRRRPPSAPPPVTDPAPALLRDGARPLEEADARPAALSPRRMECRHAARARVRHRTP